MSQVQTRVDLLQVLTEAAAIYVHIDLDKPVSSELIEEWKSQIEDGAKTIFAEEFGINRELIELEVELSEGSIWVKIKASTTTLVLILSLYNGIHKAAETLPRDYEIVAGQVAVLAEKVTDGVTNSIEGIFKNGELLYEMLERGNPINNPNPTPEDE
jgi:hypothetical protein